MPRLGQGGERVATFKAALLKVASRCNLNCDYCYVYHHVDQTWRDQPKLMSRETLQAFAARLDEYADEVGLTQFSVIFHGGEPLLFTASGLVEAAELIRGSVRSSCELDFSLQTNGVLLGADELQTLAQNGIGVSLSLDGPRHANDRHRVDHQGRSTFEHTMRALEILQEAGPDVFLGVIAVIDPLITPSEVLSFFAPMSLPRLDLLLPDATHDTPPPGRREEPDVYVRWLREAFGLWYSTYPELPIRWFDALLASRVGVPSPTDVMGLGEVNLLVLDTDGAFKDHDVFKITDSSNLARHSRNQRARTTA